MAIRTTLAPRYYWNQIIWAVACLGLGLWGCYDLWIKIPAQEQLVQDYRDAEKHYQDLEKLQYRTPEQQEQFERLDAALNQFTEAPTPPGTWDRLTQWMFISLLLCVPYFALDLAKARSRTFEMEDDGTVVLNEKQRWSPDEIADIDMSRWMKKSIATLHHRSGETAKLDAYLYRDLDKIVGHVAHRLYPAEWNEDASPVKARSTEIEKEPLPDPDAPDGGEEPRPASSEA